VTLLEFYIFYSACSWISSGTTKHYEPNFDKNFLSLTRCSFTPIGFWWGNLSEGDHSEERGVRWEDNIKMDLQELGWVGMDWMIEDRDVRRGFVNAVINP